MAELLNASLAKLEQFEGVIPWMYRDTVGRVTVGVGTMLAESAAAERLPFQLTGQPATRAEIAAEFARVDTLPMGRPALFYRREGGPELDRPAIDALLRTVVTDIDTALRARVAGYPTMPQGVQLALIDMAYNLGTAGLLDGYPKLIHAVESGKWTQAAANSFRHGPGAERNEWTRQMLLGNVVGTLAGEAESGLKRIGFGLVGLLATWFGY